MSSLSYGGIYARDVLTEFISSVPVLDASGVDMIGNRITGSWLFTLHSIGGTQVEHGVNGGENIGAAINTVLTRMSQHRQRFTFETNGVTVIDVYPGATHAGGGQTAATLGQMDVEGGPKPHVEILGIPGTEACRVRFSIDTVVPVCAGSGLGSGILSLRFWIADDIDLSNWSTTRSYTGRLRLAHHNYNPHAFRHLVLPPVQPGFAPTRATFHGSEDGLTLDFSIEFSEQWAQAPAPATYWEGHHSVSSPMAGGAIGESEIHVMLRGDKKTPKPKLLALATKIISNKLHYDDLAKDGSNFLLYAAYNDNLKHNEIQATARVRNVGDYSLANVAARDLGQPLTLPGYNKEIAHIGSPTANAAGLFLSVLQSPCSPASMPQVLGSAYPQPEPEQAGTPIYITQGTTPPAKNEYSSSHQRNLYTDYRESNDYAMRQGRVHLPVSKSTGTASKGAATSIVVPLFQAQATRTIRISAERLKAWPELPAPADFRDDNGIDHALLTWRPMPHSPQLSGDGVKTLHTVDYELVYGLSRQPTASETLSVGRIPIRNLVQAEAVTSKMPPSVYQPYSSNGGIV